MRKALWVGVVFAAMCWSVSGQTAAEIVGKYVQNIGGKDKIAAIQSMRQMGTFHGGGGFEAAVVNESKRPNMVREEFALQGFTAMTVYDGKTGWKINPFSGKKDAETLGEEELKSIVEDSDFDGPLVDYAAKGNKVEFVGKEEYEGSDVYKLKVTLANGTVKFFFLDTEFYIPIKIETKQINRGAEVEFESVLGDYKQVAGIYFPFSIESGAKGSQNKSSVTFDKIEVNVPIEASRFTMPESAKKP